MIVTYKTWRTGQVSLGLVSNFSLNYGHKIKLYIFNILHELRLIYTYIHTYIYILYISI